MRSHISRTLLCAILLAYFYALLQSAWLCDDAFITLRVVDHFLNGYGLCWNIVERVQVYTHPLWMMLLTAACGITHDFYLAPIWLSITLSMTAMALLAYQNRAHPHTAALACGLLLFSKSFVDYSTSGLENPLSYLLLVLFYGTVLINPRALSLSLIASFIILNRLDHVFLLIPVLVYFFVGKWNLRERGYVLLGLTPFLFWELFSLFYYGFLLPNTAYAKLYGTGIPLAIRLELGWHYGLNLLQNDPVAGLLLVVAFVIAGVSSNNSLRLIAGGIALQLAYIVWIGGDFMSGRMFTPALLAAAVIASRAESRWLEKVWLPSFLLIVLIGFCAPAPPLLNTPSFGLNQTGLHDSHNIYDERKHYYPLTGLLSRHPQKVDSLFLEIRRHRAQDHPQPLRVLDKIGLEGFLSAPQTHIVDYLALADPLLPRLPALQRPPDDPLFPGHFAGYLPDGYLETILSRDNQLQDPALASFYEKIHLITQADLFETQRLWEIVKLNFGFTKPEINRSFYQSPPQKIVSLEQIPPPNSEPVLWFDPSNIHFLTKGIRIEFNVKTVNRILLEVDAYNDYRIVLQKEKQDLLEINHSAPQPPAETLLNVTIPLISPNTIDSIAIEPTTRVPRFTLGTVVVE